MMMVSALCLPLRVNERTRLLTVRRHAVSKTTGKGSGHERGKVCSSSREPPAKESA
jgi:hypothetical protein